MTTFALDNMPEIADGLYHFRKLVVNQCCLFDEFCDEVAVNPQYKSELMTLMAYMNFMSKENTKIPPGKFNHILDKGETIGHEFKSKHLRVYIIKIRPNVIIVLGGYKATQKKDVSRFKSLVEQLKNTSL